MKSLLRSPRELSTEKDDEAIIDKDAVHPLMDDELDLGNVARKVHIKKGSVEELALEKSGKDKLEGLMNDGTFITIHG